jgi:hypothetical protein
MFMKHAAHALRLVRRAVPAFDLKRAGQLAAALILVGGGTLTAAPASEAGNVFDIACASGGPAFARLVPLQLNRSALVRASFTKEPPFAIFEFRATKTNLHTHKHSVLINKALVESRVAPHCVNERESGITFAPNPKAYDVIERTHDAMRPSNVSPVVDRMRIENIGTFGHDEIAFMEARQQAFVIAASNAKRYDAAFTSKRVIGAIVFILDGHLLHATRESPRLYRWDRREYEEEIVDVSFVTRDNINSDEVQRRLVGKLGVNLPLPRSISSSAMEQSDALSDGLPPPMISASGAGESSGASDPKVIELHPSPAFENGGRDCAEYKTHFAIKECFDKGSALLLVAPSAPKPDWRFNPLKVIGAIVYPRRDAREALIVRWDNALEEYVDTAYGQGAPSICRTCLWEPQIQASIRRAMEPAFHPIVDRDPLPYSTNTYPKIMSHEQAAQLLQRLPDTCSGLVAEVPAKDAPNADRGFTPPIPAIGCVADGVIRLWSWYADDDDVSFVMLGVLPQNTPQLYLNAYLASYTDFETRRVSFARVKAQDTAGMAAAAEARRKQEEQQRVARAEAAATSRRATVRKVLTFALPVLSVLFFVLLILLLLRMRAEFLRAKRRREQRVAVATRERDLGEIASMRADLEERISVIEGVRRRYMKRIAEIRHKWGLQ